MQRQTVAVAGRRLRVSNLDRVLYPATDTTKADVFDYWAAVAPVLLPQLHGRPVTRKRWPEGVGTDADPGPSFFRKNLEDSAPDWIPTVLIEHSDHSNRYPLADSPAVLAWFAQVAALELHVPQWRVDEQGRPGAPDRMVLDLDPGSGVSLADCAQVASWCREILDTMGLNPVPVTSGSTGIHLYTAMTGQHSAEQVRAMARELARSLEADHPDQVISRMTRVDRTGKVFIDWSQNSASKTTVAPYSLRGRTKPYVAAPRTWAELADPDLVQLTAPEVIARLADGVDPFADFAGATTASGSVEKAGKAGAERAAVDDRLAEYRAKRDPAKTPEPVPSDADARGSHLDRGASPIFVIQEHHARRLHFDTRVERDGVLVSWAVPKGPPLRQGVQRLAVRTEDHPLSYAEFSGTIPRGEYGAGQMSIWDRGRAEIETWEDAKVVLVLHPDSGGGLGGIPRRYALIRTGDERQWLIRLTRDQPDQPARPTASAQTRPEAVPLPDPLPAPMLAEPARGGPDRREPRLSRQGWVFEGKWDGYRAIAALPTEPAEGGLILRSRNDHDLSATFPELAELTTLVPPGTVLDGEIVALGAGGRPDFGRLQLRGRLTQSAEIAQATEQIPVHYFAFDLLHTAAHGSLLARPYTERRAMLQELLRTGSRIQVPTDLGTSFEDALATSEDLDLEGIVAKRADSRYRPGRRSADWVKMAHHHSQEVVIIGWRHGQGGRADTFASLLVAVPVDGALRYAGRVGTGFSEPELRGLRSDLDRAQRSTPPADDVPATDAADATWVSPRIVGEVKHAGRSRAGRLRHPVWRGTRPDKDAAQVAWDPAELPAVRD